MRLVKGIIKSGLIVASFGLVVSCKSKDDSAPEPTINIHLQSPAEGTVFLHGDTVHISAHVSSPVQAHGYEWTIKKANGTLLHSGSDHVHGEDFTITGEYVNNVDTTTAAILEITIEIDHDGNESKKTVSFTLNQ